MIIERLSNYKHIKLKRIEIHNGGIEMLTLAQMKERNRTNTTLKSVTIEEKEYSEEFIKQCESEFKTFVKPIRDKVVGRMLGEKKS